jgi:hypothetical protein
MGAAKITTDHDEIRTWVEERGGVPAHVRHTSDRESGLGVLRIDFPGVDAEESLELLDWDDWFRAFDEHRLAFLHEEEGELGDESRFNKIVSRDCIGSAERGGLGEETEDEPDSSHRHAHRRPSARRIRA